MKNKNIVKKKKIYFKFFLKNNISFIINNFLEAC